MLHMCPQVRRGVSASICVPDAAIYSSLRKILPYTIYLVCVLVFYTTGAAGGVCKHVCDSYCYALVRARYSYPLVRARYCYVLVRARYCFCASSRQILLCTTYYILYTLYVPSFYIPQVRSKHDPATCYISYTCYMLHAI
jgi:hypothetical protein